MDRCMRIDGWMDEGTNGGMDGWWVGWMYDGMDGWLDGGIRWMIGGMNG